MADYGYTHGWSRTNGNGRFGNHSTWGSTNTMAEEGWSTPGFVTKTEVVHKEHICRPVIVDPDGTTRPGVVILPLQHKDGVVSKTETVVERVYPSPSPYMNGYDAKTEAHKPKVYGHSDDQTPTINEFISNAQTAVSGPYQNGTSGGLFQRGTPNTLNSYGGMNRWSKPSSGSNNFETNGWSKPSSGSNNFETNGWSKPSSGSNDFETNGWRKPISGMNDTDTNRWRVPIGSTNDRGTNEWGRSSGRDHDYSRNGWSTHQPAYDDSSSDDEPDGSHTPTKVTTNVWSRPNHVGWNEPTGYDRKITKPTSDIGASVDYVKESSRPSSVTTTTPWQGRFSSSSPTYPLKENKVESIDSKEAQKKYGGASVSPTITNNPRSVTIDAREAARKYKGMFV